MKSSGRVIWITGLSGAGKTTLAKELISLLPQPRILLDGDEMRKALEVLTTGYDRESRLKLSLTYSNFCKLASEQGMTVVCSVIAMFHDVHKWNLKNLPNYFEVFLDMPLSIIRDRDCKCVYLQSNGSQVVGQDVLPEFPLNPNIRFTDPKQTALNMATYIMTHL